MSASIVDAERVKDLVRSRLLGGDEGLEGLSPPERRLRVRSEVAAVLREVRAILPAAVVSEVVNQVSDEVVGLGPIERLLRDPEVSEVMVNGADDIYVERKGRIERAEGLFFEGEEQVYHLIERIVAPLGLRVDESSPYVDARLPDGARVNAVIPPLSLCGPVVTIRKFTLRPFTPGDLIALDAASPEMIEFLGACVRAKANIIVSGGTGSGKTTLLGVLSSFIPSSERLITIEDAAELRLSQPHVVSLEARPPNIEGAGEVTVRALVRNALRMRPDRIVVGEVRGGEALDMLQAMNTGHEGSLSTAHANSPRDLLSRLETMALMADVELPVAHVREQIAAAVDLVVHTMRLGDGRRLVTRVSSIEGLRGGAVIIEDVFQWRPAGGAFERLPGRRSIDELIAGESAASNMPAAAADGEGAGSVERGPRATDDEPPARDGSTAHRRARNGLRGRLLRWPGPARRLGTILDCS
jgi:pilus assembly protein CpaF